MPSKESGKIKEIIGFETNSGSFPLDIYHSPLQYRKWRHQVSVIRYRSNPLLVNMRNLNSLVLHIQRQEQILFASCNRASIAIKLKFLSFALQIFQQFFTAKSLVSSLLNFFNSPTINEFQQLPFVFGSFWEAKVKQFKKILTRLPPSACKVSAIERFSFVPIFFNYALHASCEVFLNPVLFLANPFATKFKFFKILLGGYFISVLCVCVHSFYPKIFEYCLVRVPE